MKREIFKELLNWKTHPSRMPLILRGARQVGKTYIVERFGKECFDSTVTLNLEFRPEYVRCFNSLDPKEIINRIESITGIEIIPGKTLLFIDEIQTAPKAIVALRYFKELMPELHLIAAGSLLEFALHEENFSFPVGRVQFMYLLPLSFNEFLNAAGHNQSIKALESASLKNPLSDVVHDHLMKMIRKYFIVGGMPAVIDAYLKREKLIECEMLQGIILDTYRNDFGKYATKTQYKNLLLFFERAPGIVSQHFKFVKITQEIRSKDLKIALDQLVWAGLVKRVHLTEASGVPLRFRMKENKFKLLFLDIGLLQRANQIDSQAILDMDLIQINQGALTEQFVGQELLAYSDFSEEKRIYFWEREAKSSSSEVDYVINLGSKIIPIEVKAGSTGRLRSLKRFMEEKKCDIGIRISELPLSFEKGTLSVPFYLIKKIPQLLKELLPQ